MGERRSGGLHAVWVGCLDRLTRWRSSHRSSSFLCIRRVFVGLSGLALLLLLLLGLWMVTDREDKSNSLTLACCSVNAIMVLMATGLAGSTLSVTVTMSVSTEVPPSVWLRVVLLYFSLQWVIPKPSPDLTKHPHFQHLNKKLQDSTFSSWPVIFTHHTNWFHFLLQSILEPAPCSGSKQGSWSC